MQDLISELTSGDDERAENSIAAIAEFGAAAIPPLLELTRAHNSDLRWWAVRALAASTHTRAENLLPLLNDSAPDVRAAAALALCNHPEESAVPALIQSLADEDALTSSLAATALAKIGQPAVESLIAAAEREKMSARICALRALSEIGDHRAIPIFMKSMSEESALLQYWAQIGLERLGLDMIYLKP